MKSVDRCVLCITAGVAIIVLVVHFGVTLLYVFPLNPLKVELSATLEGYTGQLFAQNWSLFAPSPIHTNLGLLAQCRARDGRLSSWYDVTGAFIDGLHRQPFGPYVRLVRLPFDAMRNHDGGDIDQDSSKIVDAICRVSRNSESCLERDPAVVASVKLGDFELQGLASSVCADVFPGNVAAVRLDQTDTNLRPWSERASKTWHATTVSLGSTRWMPYRDVTPMRLAFDVSR